VSCGRAACRRRLDFNQELITDHVPQGVVDDLEAVEVEQTDEEAFARAFRPGDRLTEPFLENRTVRQTGERIVQGEVFQTITRPLTLEGDRGEVCRFVHDEELIVRRQPYPIRINRERAVHDPSHVENRRRPAGAQTEFERQMARRFPARVGRNIVHDDGLAEVGRRAARAIGGADPCLGDQFDPDRRQRRSGGDMFERVALAAQNRTDAPGDAELDALDQVRENL
jgi:hypothetical protein